MDSYPPPSVSEIYEILLLDLYLDVWKSLISPVRYDAISNVLNKYLFLDRRIVCPTRFSSAYDTIAFQNRLINLTNK